MTDCRILVVSCGKRRPIQELWAACQKAHWPDCTFPIDILSPANDVGWNANLLRWLETATSDLVLLLLDDHFIAESPAGQYTSNITAVIELLAERKDIGMIKLQAGNAHPPEIPFPAWPRLREYDRAHHPFKRTNLVPTVFRTEWLKRLTAAVLDQCREGQDVGRLGAIHFEVFGTDITESRTRWPEKMLGIHRPAPDYSMDGSLLTCMDSDAVREGRLKKMAGRSEETLQRLSAGIVGLEAFA